jgi:hypothetical protein
MGNLWDLGVRREKESAPLRRGKKKARCCAAPMKNKIFLASEIEIIADTLEVGKQHMPTLYLSVYICRDLISCIGKRRHIIRWPFALMPTLYWTSKVYIFADT